MALLLFIALISDEDNDGQRHAWPGWFPARLFPVATAFQPLFRPIPLHDRLPLLARPRLVKNSENTIVLQIIFNQVAKFVLNTEIDHCYALSRLGGENQDEGKYSQETIMKKMIAVCMFATLGLAGWSLTTDAAKANTRANSCFTSFRNCRAAAKLTCGDDVNCLATLYERCLVQFNQCSNN